MLLLLSDADLVALRVPVNMLDQVCYTAVHYEPPRCIRDRYVVSRHTGVFPPCSTQIVDRPWHFEGKQVVVLTYEG